jgi:hypothetical protein
MKFRTSLTPLRVSLWSALGLSPLVACGGETAVDHPTTVAGSGGGSTVEGSGGRFSGGTAGADGSGGTPLVILACRNPQPYVGSKGQPTGLVVCDGNYAAVHRAARVDCGSSLPRPPGTGCTPAGTGGCQQDSDCTERPYGHCDPPVDGPAPVFCTSCAYGCVRDSDCAADEVCLCLSSLIGECIAAGCATDQDCGGLLCLTYPTAKQSGAADNCYDSAIACQTPSDQCVSSGDCANGAPCVVMASGQRACRDALCGQGGVGRPFIVEGSARLAATACRSDWSSSLAPQVDDLTADARAALAARWTEVGLMEHASIAANARFALELLSLGAPPELVQGSYEAMADETVHARDAFALASAYAGCAVGPGALDVSRALAASSPIEIVRRAILEGCFGETVCAAEAAEALASSEDEAVRATLRRVVGDETRHAELVWRFVNWVLEHGDPELRGNAAVSLGEMVDAERLATSRPALDPSARNDGLRPHGVLDSETLREIRRRVLLDVIEPCAHALLGKVAVNRGESVAETKRRPT